MSDLRHKTPDELRAEIRYQERRIASCDASIQNTERGLLELRQAVADAEATLSRQRINRNGHQQRLVWAKNYLLIKNSD